MNADIKTRKAMLRREIADRVASLSEQVQAQNSSKAIALLQEQTIWKQSQSVLLYAPMKNELDVWPLVQIGIGKGKIMALPRFDDSAQCYMACRIKDVMTDVEQGRYGIREPRCSCESVALNQLDLVLVPGVGFDLHGHRLGRGKGYYDRLLGAMRGQACGVAFNEQIVREIPVDPHDSDVNCILTPTRWIEL